jgi:GNAT superfamily N-acetyltransferase
MTIIRTDLYSLVKNTELKIELSKLTLSGSSALTNLLRCSLVNKNYPVLLVYNKNKIIAWITTTEDYGSVHKPVAIFVSPNFRRQQIGTRLITEYSLITPEKVLFCIPRGDGARRFFVATHFKWNQKIPLQVETIKETFLNSFRQSKHHGLLFLEKMSQQIIALWANISSY